MRLTTPPTNIAANGFLVQRIEDSFRLRARLTEPAISANVSTKRAIEIVNNKGNFFQGLCLRLFRIRLR